MKNTAKKWVTDTRDKFRGLVGEGGLKVVLCDGKQIVG